MEIFEIVEVILFISHFYYDCVVLHHFMKKQLFQDIHQHDFQSLGCDDNKIDLDRDVTHHQVDFFPTEDQIIIENKEYFDVSSREH